MSTRCNIAVVVNESDTNRQLNLINYAKEVGFDLNRIVNGKYTLEETYNKEITVKDRVVLQIYCHHDGYPDGVGAELLDRFNSYEEALALVLAGDTSYIEDGKTGAYAVHEGYETNLPVILDSPSRYNMYLYVWKDGEWTIGENGESLESCLKEWE